jgi:hypothetical protein
LVKSIAKVKLCRLLGKVALSTLWFGFLQIATLSNPLQQGARARAAAEEDQLAEGSLVQRLPVLGRAEAGSTCFVY